MASLLNEVRVEEISSQVVAKEDLLNGWDIRHARHLTPEQYEYTDDWQTVNVDDIWARQGQTAFMKRDITIPKDWGGRGRRVAAYDRR
ncbi:MAG: hypothetical protein ACYC64_14930 [Armatimonadota bacterium]